jgi:hypothetical protein
MGLKQNLSQKKKQAEEETKANIEQEAPKKGTMPYALRRLVKTDRQSATS